MFLKVCMLSIIFDVSGLFGSYSEIIELVLKKEKPHQFYSEAQTE